MLNNSVKYKALSFAAVLDMWLISNKVRIKHTTYDKYRYMIDRHIVPSLGNYPIERLDTVVINSFLDKKLKYGGIDSNAPLAPSYVGTMSLIISASIHFAANEELCSNLKNPIFKPNSCNKEIQILDKKDTIKLTKYISNNIDETGLGILLALYTGLRIGEVCALRWLDIDFHNKVLFVRKTVSRINDNGKVKHLLDTPKTKSSIRCIPIPQVFINLLKTAYNKRMSTFVISNKEGFVLPRTFEYRYHKFLKHLGIDNLNFHALRHTFATNCITNGMDVKSLSEILGHANTSTTLQIYVHPSMDIKRKQMNKVFQ